MTDPSAPLTIQWGRIAYYTREFVPCGSEEEAKALCTVFPLTKLAWRYIGSPHIVEEED